MGKMDMTKLDRFGIAMVMISTLDGRWGYPRFSFTNDDKPQKCELSQPNNRYHMQYVRDVLQWVGSQPEVFDAKRLISSGSSQNGKFSNAMGFCFGDRLAGIVAGCGGMTSKCKTQNGKQSCGYAPIRPCYEPTHQLPWCGFTYDRDFGRGAVQSMDTLFDVARDEGLDARYFKMVGSAHRMPNNWLDWVVGCTGIKDPCTSACEGDFLKCIETFKRLRQGGRFRKCYRAGGTNKRPASCSIGCAPTLNMMLQSETPSRQELTKGEFGRPASSSAPPRPDTSKCVAQHTPH